MEEAVEKKIRGKMEAGACTAAAGRNRRLRQGAMFKSEKRRRQLNSKKGKDGRRPDRALKREEGT
jgi:hypothetical protein